MCLIIQLIWILSGSGFDNLLIFLVFSPFIFSPCVIIYCLPDTVETIWCLEYYLPSEDLLWQGGSETSSQSSPNTYPGTEMIYGQSI